jgi:hypothetical protein
MGEQLINRRAVMCGRNVPSAVRLAVLVLAASGLAAGQAVQDAKSNVSEKAFTAEQLAVYRATLSNFVEDGPSVVNLAIRTEPLQSSGPSGDGECAKGLELEPAVSAVIHRFRAQDIPQLGLGNIRLVDPDLQRKEVAENDPEQTTRDGRSIEDAVSNGFEHGLVTLSEIQFDKEHKLAIVSYGFFCGSLCGNGGTVVLEKREGAWHRKTRCHDWISWLTLPGQSHESTLLSSLVPISIAPEAQRSLAPRFSVGKVASISLSAP